MIGIKIAGKWVDLPQNVQLSFVLNNSMFFGSDIDKIIGSYTIPISVGSTRTNCQIFGFANMLEIKTNFLTDIDVEVYYCMNQLFSGKVFLNKAGSKGFRFSVLINALQDITNKSLDELDLGGDRTIGTSPADMVAHANDTAVNPQDYDYIFFPIRNECFFHENEDIEPGTPESKYQNFYDTDNQTFINDINQNTAMPFVKLKYVLQQIFACFDIELSNQFQDTPELENLVLYNNFSIYFVQTWSNTINLKNHVSDTKLNDFLKSIMRNFSLGIFTDLFSNTKIILKPLKDVLSASYRWDWSKKCIVGFNKCIERSFPGKMCYAKSDDKLENKYQDKLFRDEFITVQSYADIDDAGYPNGTIAYVINLNQYYAIGSPTREIPLTRIMHCYDTGCNSIPYESKIGTTFMTVRQQTSVGGDSWMLPHIQIPGTHIDEELNAKFPDKLLFYRGMHENSNGDLYPFATNNIYDMFGQVIGDYSLLWDRDPGLFNQWWSAWYELIKKAFTVDKKICLTLADLLQFSFEDKVYIHNQEYFVKQMKVTLTNHGIKPVTVKLVSTT